MTQQTFRLLASSENPSLFVCRPGAPALPRDYGMNERAETPADSREKNG
jgi:hypothetical protein